MRRLAPLVSCGLLLIASACNDAPDSGTGGASAAAKTVSALLDDASTAIDAGEWSKAIVSLDAAIADPKATADEKALAWQDKVLCEAQATGDPAAIATLHKLVDAKVELTPDQFAKLGIDLANADKTDASLEVIAVATKKFAGDKRVKTKLTRLASLLEQKFAASGNTAGTDKLNALGYLGNTSDDEEDEVKPPAAKPEGKSDG